MGVARPKRRGGRVAKAPPAAGEQPAVKAKKPRNIGSSAKPRAVSKGPAGGANAARRTGAARVVRSGADGTGVNGTTGASRGRAAGTGAGRVAKAMKRVFTIPSDYAAAREVQRQIMADVEGGGFNEDSTFAIRIDVEEALVNAIKHGSRLSPRKKVRVQSQVGGGKAEIVIEDEGPGFKRKGVPDPTADENLCRPSGRGILLIESYMTKATWDHGGRRVRMVKHNESLGLPIR